jgi:hypothetical protein
LETQLCRDTVEKYHASLPCKEVFCVTTQQITQAESVYVVKTMKEKHYIIMLHSLLARLLQYAVLAPSHETRHQMNELVSIHGYVICAVICNLASMPD